MLHFPDIPCWNHSTDQATVSNSNPGDALCSREDDLVQGAPPTNPWCAEIFRSSTVTKRRDAILRHYRDYRRVARYSEAKIRALPPGARWPGPGATRSVEKHYWISNRPGGRREATGRQQGDGGTGPCFTEGRMSDQRASLAV